MKCVSTRVAILAAALCMTLGFSSIGVAQDQATSAPAAAGSKAARPARMQNPIMYLRAAQQIKTLDAEQQKKLKGVEEKLRKQYMELMSEVQKATSGTGTLTPQLRQSMTEKFGPKFEKLSKESIAEINDVLKPEQKQELEKTMQEAESRMMQRTMMRPGTGTTSAPAHLGVKP